ncbi:hypothetical protein Aph01nite_05870 [Acrocarpospora phusangensis]|uniref:Lipoprotein n=1 Tax=Acrocarpospora phusangensis TaxID=1070424 RepID=A0A919ULJ9_9ACTN|nr:hypothetical protein [Acrocarpospora phusangensis]GIH22277.1 hypothetical protein Aph01nite_05870 [Acrocarpospora phusangensis]
MRILQAGRFAATLIVLTSCGSILASTPTATDDFIVRAKEVAERREGSEEGWAGLQEVFTYETVTPQELKLSYGHGACDSTFGARVYETAQVVVVDVDVREDYVQVCTAIMLTDQIGVRLDEPLGTRVVLDSRSGLPASRGTDRDPSE